MQDSGFPPTTLPYNGLDLNGHGTHVAGRVATNNMSSIVHTNYFYI